MSSSKRSIWSRSLATSRFGSGGEAVASRCAVRPRPRGLSVRKPKTASGDPVRPSAAPTLVIGIEGGNEGIVGRVPITVDQAPHEVHVVARRVQALPGVLAEGDLS